MESNDITVVIVTFQSDHQIFSCIDTIPKNIKIIIAENSNNQTFKKKIEEHSQNIECFLLKENKGYATANNFALSKVKTKYALILNPDTRLTKNTLKNFFETASKYSNFWIIGPNQKFTNTDNENKVIEVNNIKGYAMFLNISKFKGLFFDENFFLYFEEIDLCKQTIIKKGTILINSNIVVEHKGGSSVKLSSKHELEKNRNWHWMWSTYYFHKKYKGFFLAIVIVLPKLISSIFKIIFYKLTHDKKSEELYNSRLSGLINSILGKKSWFRPVLN